MRTAAMKEFVDASASEPGPLSAIAADSVEDGMVIGSVLKTNLEKAGYTIEVKNGDKHGFHLTVKKDDVMVAWAFGPTESEALKQAIAAEVKEESKPKLELVKES